MRKFFFVAIILTGTLLAQSPCTMHDPTQFHGLVSADPNCPCAEQCSNDHEHGDDPSDIAVFSGQFPAIPQTPEAHELWKYHVRTGIPPEGEGDLYIRNLIVLAHVGGINRAMEVQFHGTVTWAEICHKTTGQCGVYKQRASTDFGCLQVITDAGQIDSPFGQCNGNRRLHFRVASAPWLNGRFTWYGNQGIYNEPEPGNRVYVATSGRAISGNDAWSSRDPADWNEWLWNCPELDYCTAEGCQPDPSTVDVSGCGYNDSNRGIEGMSFTIFGNPGDVITVSGFTDPAGAVDASCLSEGPNCYPFSLENVPAGFAAYRPGDSVEYDNLQGLIGFPN